MIILRVKIRNILNMKLEVTNLFILTIFTSIINYVMCEGSEDNLQKSLRHHHHHDNFLLIDFLKDGEMEKRISYNGITAKQTSVGNSSKTIHLWQLSDGKAFIQMIYSSDDQVLDCEYIRKKDLVRSFLDKYYAEVDKARERNFTSPFIVPRNKHSVVSDHEFREYIDNNIVTSEMDELNYNIAKFSTSSIYEEDAFGMRNLTYKQIKSYEDVPQDMRQLINYHHLKKQCDIRHRQMTTLAHSLNSNDEEVKKAATDHLERRKRGISDWFVAPNTKWCGKGNTAEIYRQLGGASRADMCCRKHDHCKSVIHAFDTKHELFNYRPYSISHCHCDLRFRTCLKMADSSDANMVGKLFFNVLETKCFVLKREKYCAKKSWWGKCELKKYKKRAHLVDNRSY